MHLLPSIATIAVPLSFRAGQGSLHEIATSAFSRTDSPLGRANVFSFLFLLLNPCIISINVSSFTLFLSASFSLVSILSFTHVLCPANFSMDSISSWFPPISFHAFSTTLSHLIPARPFVNFSHTALSAMAGNLFCGMFLTLYCHFIFLTSLVYFSGYIPSSALHAVLLVVLEHPRTFLAAVICTVSSCFTNFAFPSHTTSAYSSFGTITLIIIYIF